jgi:hypothetical protein
MTIRVGAILSVTMRAVVALIAGPLLAEALLTTVYLPEKYVPLLVTVILSSLVAGVVAGYGVGVIAGRRELIWAAVVGVLTGWMVFSSAPYIMGVTTGAIPEWLFRAQGALIVPTTLLGGYLRLLQLRRRHDAQANEGWAMTADRWAYRLGSGLCLISLPVGCIVGASTDNPMGGVFAVPLLGLGLVLFLGARPSATTPPEQYPDSENVPAERTRCDTCGVEYPSHRYLQPAGSQGYICRTCSKSR